MVNLANYLLSSDSLSHFFSIVISYKLFYLFRKALFNAHIPHHGSFRFICQTWSVLLVIPFTVYAPIGTEPMITDFSDKLTSALQLVLNGLIQNDTLLEVWINKFPLFNLVFHLFFISYSGDFCKLTN